MNINEKAKLFAYEKHSNQKRKGKNIPYTTHLDLVNYILSTLTDKEEILAVGWLHDVVEDTDTTLDEILNIFGDRISHLVDLETEKKEKDSIKSWRKRKESQLKELKELEEKDLEVLLITFSDKMANLMEITLLLEIKFGIGLIIKIKKTITGITIVFIEFLLNINLYLKIILTF